MFEIWHTQTNNIVDYFNTAAQAEATIIDAVRTQGDHILDATYMIRVGDDGESHFVGEGKTIPVAITIYRLLDELRDGGEMEAAIIRESLRDTAISDYLRSLPNLDKLGVHGSRELMQGMVIGGLLARLPSVFPTTVAKPEAPSSKSPHPVSGPPTL